MAANAVSRCSLLFMAICLTEMPCLAQKTAQPSQDGKTLETLMKSIEETVNSVGPVAYTVHGHDSSNGHDWKNRFSNQASTVVANSSACRINYRWTTIRDGRVLMDAGVGFLLRDVQRVDVLTRLRYFNEENVAIGHPSWTAEIDPVVFMVRVQRPAHVENHFVFLSEETANKVAEALTHAVKLCSGR